ncbi:type II secretion system F family protein [Dasania sp. GY-MA-18]|uniref:Type II secretion system F family protein n=1 Tax=Dasania phycosphaerae TaxID=2950436 RepID=A0A9J6RNN3_9GAMM|nr:MULTISPECIES: type II secretion system F family protein [Dasania]MCR8923674.1 type II secretion system F family protein [Dasania sp. GY-MA-18]MCZ0866108.1 type II secretion system F family protein [Dasania phycosphaerae]MCZ0869832.1 type II secretion system F family protein [Dasania phycosphaerae]
MATTIKTSTFTYKGTDKQGKEVKGEIQGSNQTMVKAQLRKQGVIAKSVRKKANPILIGGGKKIKPADVAIFTRQLATMMKAGVPLVQSFDIVAEGLDNPSMRDLVMEIKNDVASGSGFAPSIAKHPKYFDDLFCSLIASGEQSGTLETMLDRVATYKEKSEALKAKIKKAMTYPIAILVIALVVTALLLIKVIPQFAESFTSFGADLPAFTKMVMGLSDFVIEWWLIILVGIIGSVFTLKESIKRSETVSLAADKIILKVPIVGDIIYNSIIARFARTLSTTFAAGVPLVDALQAVAGTAGNVIYKDAIIKIKDDVTTGTQLNQSIRASGLFPSMVLQMVAIGEESGALDSMLEKVAIHFEDVVDNMVDNMTALLEPIIMAVLGVLIGGLMIAMYLPIFMLGSAI